VAEIVFVREETMPDPELPPFMDPGKAADHTLKVFPNPVENTLYLAGLETITGRCTVTLLDFFGLVVFNRELSEEEKKGLYRLDVSQFTGGVYFLVVQSGNKTKTKKIIKL
jgi:hypothetical protein